MGASAITALCEIILEAVKLTGNGEWKVLVLDAESRRLIDNVVKEDDLLQQNVTNIEQIEHKRGMNPGLDALYILSPEPYVVDYLIDDFHRRRYQRAHVIWATSLDRNLRTRIDSVTKDIKPMPTFRTLNIGFYPRESHLITFRDKWSFPLLYHPACNGLIRNHLRDLAQKIVSVCVSLGEYPIIRYYKPKEARHGAGVLCSHIALYVQETLDDHAKWHDDFPPPSPRPRGILFITDRTMDMVTPLIHEFTFQSLVYDLLPIRGTERETDPRRRGRDEGDSEDRAFYTLNEGSAERKVMELSETDKIWVANRHLHMGVLVEKLAEDFGKFKAANPQFAEQNETSTSINNIKDMIAGLPQFQEGKEAYSLHLDMASKCVEIFEKHLLRLVGIAEQTLATRQDELYRKPKNILNEILPLLDHPAVAPFDRLRLLIQYIIYRDGVFPTDMTMLLNHSDLPPRWGEIISNLDILGVRVDRPKGDGKNPSDPLFPKEKPPGRVADEESPLSRYDPVIKGMIEGCLHNALDDTVFPLTRPSPDSTPAQTNVSQASLRNAKPTWARTRPSALEPRQRIIVFMAGGATYSESRVCYDISDKYAKDVYLATSHMQTPNTFIEQLRQLSDDRSSLNLPIDREPPRAHIQPSEPVRAPTQQSQGPPTAAMGSLGLGHATQSRAGSGSGSVNGKAQDYRPLPAAPAGGTESRVKEKEKIKKKPFYKIL